MHDRGKEIEDRLGRVMEERVRPAIHHGIADLRVEVWHVPPSPDGTVGEPVAFDVARAATYAPASVGDRWGPAWGTSWFHLAGTVPADPATTDVATPEIVFDLGWSTRRPGMQAEALVHRPDGSVVKGLNPQNSWIAVTPGEEIDLYVEAAANPTIGPGYTPTREGDRDTSTREPLYRISRAEICTRNVDVFELNADVDVLDGLQRSLGEGDARRWEIRYALERAAEALDPHDVVGTAAAARAELADVLARPAHASAHRITAIGHAHIDSAWLWPVRETVRKVSRTVANVTHLLDTTDDLRHCMSSAQQWEWLEESRPELFERVRGHVETGRFIPVGGMWVESDTNMVGGEAMARQFVMGKQWFIDKLGVDCEEVWLPDSFGYTAALPQIVKLAGFRWFLTQKISWNTVNKFPHHTFWWEGIDGTRVFTHFPPADTYNGTLAASQLAHTASNFRDKGIATRSLIPFGHGDGGGGPTRDMLSRARRTASLEGSPQVAIESPAEFFTAAEGEYGAAAPVWSGELYLEIHRGTYTSQARTKQGNRRSEHLLREAELWSTYADLLGLVDYPYDELRAIWKTVLLQQFHDILPGSSIAWVHREAELEYARVAGELEAIIERAISALAGAEAGSETGSGAGSDGAVFDASPVAFLGRGLDTLAGARYSTNERKRSTTEPEGSVLENEHLRVEVDESGVIRSIRDLDVGREVLPPGGAANLLQIHPDFPNKWDAWDLDRFYRNQVTDLAGSVSAGTDGSLEVHGAFGESTYTQVITLVGGRVDIETTVDWHEREKVLKLAFDTDVHTDRARYETQFGHVTRPTHENTTWDAARFEVCAHRWVQVEDGGYGVAVANDSTYGHDVTRHPRTGGGTFSTVRQTLLRAPRYPDPETDQGRHTFRSSLVPGAGVAEAAAAGYALNLPVRRVVGASVPPLVTVSGGTAYVECVKLAEDRSGDVVVRLYEPLGARTTVTLTPAFEASAVTEVDLLERPLQNDALAATEPITLTLRPFQIVTLRLARSTG
ncbi:MULTISPECIES: alpha-mannosidase [unclassified Nocardioides]|uniref:alpha-mannosidase n=1 Tax=unclassified Nocardioides TaxID=2615069 RepID=UPI0006F58C45|nr:MULTISPECIES: glycoside hydrolase family 38 C-terminal domain-containing protein [unclassified Nocardioides]KQY57066.1 alpha-mannosidase [Nocardioides sp. Root140]KRF11706.1 alpha-mannosidase [Nocardioides sp. Soil796]